MVHLVSGYVIRDELVVDMAKNLGIERFLLNDRTNAPTHINRYTRHNINRKFPKLHIIQDYKPFTPAPYAFILAFKYHDHHRKYKSKERPQDARIKRMFMELGGLGEDDMKWDTVRCWW